MRFKRGDWEFEFTFKMALALGLLVVIWKKADDLLTVENFQALVGLFG